MTPSSLWGGVSEREKKCLVHNQELLIIDSMDYDKTLINKKKIIE